MPLHDASALIIDMIRAAAFTRSMRAAMPLRAADAYVTLLIRYNICRAALRQDGASDIAFIAA